jgi:hypothetical protein
MVSAVNAFHAVDFNNDIRHLSNPSFFLIEDTIVEVLSLKERLIEKRMTRGAILDFDEGRIRLASCGGSS